MIRFSSRTQSLFVVCRSCRVCRVSLMCAGVFFPALHPPTLEFPTSKIIVLCGVCDSCGKEHYISVKPTAHASASIRRVLQQMETSIAPVVWNCSLHDKEECLALGIVSE